MAPIESARRRRRWMIPSAAAATLFIAGVTMLSVREGSRPRSEESAALSSAIVAESAAVAAPPTVATAVSPAPTPPPGPGSSAPAANMSGGGAAAGAAAGAPAAAAGERRLAAREAPREQTAVAVADAATAAAPPPPVAAAPPPDSVRIGRGIPARRPVAALEAVVTTSVQRDTLPAVQRQRRDVEVRGEGARAAAAGVAKAAAPVAQAADVASSCWVAIGDVPAGLPTQLVLDAARAPAFAAGQELHRVRTGSTTGAGADVGSWRRVAGDSVMLTLSTGGAPRAAAFAPPPPGQTVRLLLPVPASVHVDTLVLRRVECLP